MGNVQKIIVVLVDIDRLSTKKETTNPLLLDDHDPETDGPAEADTTMGFSSWSFDWTGKIEVLSRQSSSQRWNLMSSTTES